MEVRGKIGFTMEVKGKSDVPWTYSIYKCYPILCQCYPKIHPKFAKISPRVSTTCPQQFPRFPNSSEVKNLIKSNFQVELSARRLSLQAASRREKLFFLGEDVARVDGVYEMFMEHISRCIKLVGAYDGLCLLHVFWTV